MPMASVDRLKPYDARAFTSRNPSMARGEPNTSS